MQIAKGFFAFFRPTKFAQKCRIRLEPPPRCTLPDRVFQRYVSMKYNFNQVISVMLLCSVFLTSFAPLSANCQNNSNLINGIYSNLSTACNIVAGSRIYTDLQNARYYLNQAQRLLKKNCVAHYFDRNLNRTIEKAKTQILWNDRSDALEYINRAMRIVENGAGKARQSHTGNNASTSSFNPAVVAVPAAIGLGALLARLFGGVSTRIPMPNIPGSVVRVH